MNNQDVYSKYSLPYSVMQAKLQAGLHQASKLVRYTWSDGSVTWCAYCGFCAGDDRWVIHHAADQVDDVLAQHLAEVHNIPAVVLPDIEGVSLFVGAGYVRAACQQCGWERDAHEAFTHADLFLAAEQHVRTTHLPTGGRCTAEGCECGDNC